ncbi:MAG: hypothetical protein SFZ03_06165 [Candidatus Melainabacteria bacterium]|nr:hypothetical protein [Candidatus Melainabacteria bacterium]
MDMALDLLSAKVGILLQFLGYQLSNALQLNCKLEKNHYGEQVKLLRCLNLEEISRLFEGDRQVEKIVADLKQNGLRAIENGLKSRNYKQFNKGKKYLQDVLNTFAQKGAYRPFAITSENPLQLIVDRNQLLPTQWQQWDIENLMIMDQQQMKSLEAKIELILLGSMEFSN